MKKEGDAFTNDRHENAAANEGCNTKGQTGGTKLGDLGVENRTLKARQAMLRWYGDILRMDEENKVKQTMKMEVSGSQKN